MIKQVEEIVKKLQKRGWCTECNSWCILDEGKDFLPMHDKETDEECKNSHYSYAKLEYFVQSKAIAVELAKFIKNDDGKCLDRGGGHSMGCGDGNNCEETRLLLSRALAEYFLKIRR